MLSRGIDAFILILSFWTWSGNSHITWATESCPPDGLPKKLSSILRDEPAPIADQNRARRFEILSRNIKNTGEVWSDEYLNALKAQPDLVRKNLIKLYPDHNPSLLIQRVENELGVDFLPIFLHPGVAKNWGEVLGFAKQFKALNKGATPFQVFKAAEKNHGTVTLLRGMVLTPDQMAEIMAHGMRAPELRDPVKAEAALKNFLDPDSPDPNLEESFADGYDRRLKQATNRRQGVQPGNNLIMSFTEIPEVARSVPYTDAAQVPLSKLNSLVSVSRITFVAPEEIEAARQAVVAAKDKPLGNQRLYVFRVNLPKWQVQYANRRWRIDGTMTIGNNDYRLKWDPRIEQFYPLAVPKDAILGVEEVPGRQPPYSVK